MKIIYKAKDITEAHIVSGMLQANGIEAHVGGYYLQGGIGDLAPFDFANVQVEDEDVAEARSIIAEYEQGDGQMADTGVIAKHTSIWPPIFFILAMLLIATIYQLVYS